MGIKIHLNDHGATKTLLFLPWFTSKRYSALGEPPSSPSQYGVVGGWVPLPHAGIWKDNPGIGNIEQCRVNSRYTGFPMWHLIYKYIFSDLQLWHQVTMSAISSRTMKSSSPPSMALRLGTSTLTASSVSTILGQYSGNYRALGIKSVKDDIIEQIKRKLAAPPTRHRSNTPLF